MILVSVVIICNASQSGHSLVETIVLRTGSCFVSYKIYYRRPNFPPISCNVLIHCKTCLALHDLLYKLEPALAEYTVVRGENRQRLIRMLQMGVS